MTLRIKRKLLFTAISFSIFVIGPILILECTLALTGWQPAGEADDPFIGISGNQTLFQKSKDGRHYEIKSSRLGYFRPAKFLAEKPDDGIRVFVIGGSTVQGRPWETETSFSQWLELCVKANVPNRTVEVVNCGGVSYASYRLRYIVAEVLEYSPDLIILCTGHNEYLEDRTYAQTKQLSPIIVKSHRMLSRLKSYQWLRSFLLGNQDKKVSKTTLEEQLVTKLDFENGLSLFDESNLQRDQVNQHFRFNVETMIGMATGRNVPICVVAPPSNQKDCFPFKPATDWSIGSDTPFSQMNLTELSEISKEDSADYYYFRGLQKHLSGKTESAASDFDLAIDLDICPLRMTNRLRQGLELAVRSTKQRTEGELILFVDLQEEFQKASPQGIIGDELLVDHVHPTIAAHQMIAKILTAALHESGIIPELDDWTAEYEKAQKDHQQSLDFGYFQRGKDRLDSVKKWARGNANNPLKK